jgi:hypothetical protein
MINTFVFSQYLRRQLSPKFIWLETENFEEAKKISNHKLGGETHHWKAYLNTLALLGFEQWLRERIPDIKINREKCSIFQPDNTSDVVCNLGLGEFKLCLITVDHLSDDFVNVPEEAITSPKFAAHFYVLLEVLEEEEKLNIHGFLRYDKLFSYCHSFNLETKFNNCYQLALSWFDTELNNLLLYSRFLSPTAIPLPEVTEVNHTAIQPLNQATSIVAKTLVNLSNWWLEVFEEGWQSAKNIRNTFDTNYAWGAARSNLFNYHHSGAKKLDFGLLLNGQSIALVVNLKKLENNQEVDVLVQVLSCNEEPDNEAYLPPGLKLKVTLNPNTSESESQEITTRQADNVIQLEFSEELSQQFRVEVSFRDAVVTEEFVL